MQNIQKDSGWEWPFQDQNAGKIVEMKYEDRKALTDEMLAKKKALQEIDEKNPFYHRAAISAEMADIRCDMSYIVQENKRLRQLIEPIGYLMERINILEGAYSHIKMVADMGRIDYSHIAKGLEEIIKLKKELKHVIEQKETYGDNGASKERGSGKEGFILQDDDKRRAST